MTARDRNMLVGVVMVVILGAFWMLALSPRRTEAGDAAALVTTAQQERDDAVARAAAAQKAKTDVKADYAVLARLGKALPAEAQTDSLLYQLQDAAGRSHVRMNSIAPAGPGGAPAGDASAQSPTGATGPAGATALKLNLEFAGSYRDLQRFVRRVQGFTRVNGDTIRVDGRLLSIDGFKYALDTETKKITATVMATAYVAAAPAPAAAPAAGSATTPSTTPQSASAPATTPASVVAGG